jgi:hypothetical protein
VVQRPAGLTRPNMTTKIGRKTETAFNAYVGVDELCLVEEFMHKATRRRAGAPIPLAQAATYARESKSSFCV